VAGVTFHSLPDGRVFVHADQPDAIVAMLSHGTYGVTLDEGDLIELLATVQDRNTQLGVDSWGDL
jgi:hypothetical protein